jgi:hypothetical protein
MKKIALLIAMLIGFVGIVPAQANTQESIVVIDANFESQLISGQVTEVCITAQVICNSTPRLRIASEFKAFNHGTMMADIIRSNNPSAHLILLESGTTKAGQVTGIQLVAALNWVSANASKFNIKAVSFSYNAGDGTRCTPSSPGVKIATTHQNIVNSLASLKANGIKFYAASGNYASGNRVDYPACIADAIAVGSSDFAGSTKLSDIVITAGVYTSAVLKSQRSALQGLHDSFPITLTDPNPVMLGNTTSVATAIAAATNR